MTLSVKGAKRSFVIGLVSRIAQQGARARSAAATLLTTFGIVFMSLAAQSAPASAAITCPPIPVTSGGGSTFVSGYAFIDATTGTCALIQAPVGFHAEAIEFTAADWTTTPLPQQMTVTSHKAGVQLAETPTCTGVGCYATPPRAYRAYVNVFEGSAQVYLNFQDSTGAAVTISYNLVPNDRTVYNFTVSGGAYEVPTPSVSSVVASSGTTLGGDTVTINGTNLSGTSSVTFDGIPAASFTNVSATQITATTPAHGLGTVPVAVTTTLGTATNNAYSYVLIPQSQLNLTVAAPQQNGSIISYQLRTVGGSGSGAVTYAVTGGHAFCSVNGNILTETGTGQCTVTATKAEDAVYAAETATATVDAGKQYQTGFTAVATPGGVSINGGTILSTLGEQGTGATSYVITSGAGSCALTGNTLTGTNAGTCTVLATNAGDATYHPATSSVTVNVTSGTTAQAPLFVSAAPAAITTNNTAALSTTGGSGTGPVSYAVTAGAEFCAIAGSSVQGTGVGTCTVTATKTGDATFLPINATTNVTVSKGNQNAITVTSTPTGVELYGTSTLSIIGGSGSGVVTYAVTAGATFCSISGDTLSGIGLGTCEVTATKAEDTNYFAGTGTLTVTVALASQSITFAQPQNIQFVVGGVTRTLNATSSSGLAVTYASTTPAVCTVAGNVVTMSAIGTCTIVADQTGDALYASAPTATRSFEVIGIKTNVTLTMPVTEINPGEDVTLTATVSPAAATGDITFFNGKAEVCFNVVPTAGVATCAVRPERGVQIFTAEFNATGNFGGSVSDPVSLTVGVPVQKTVETAARFMARRASLILNNMFSGGRQIDRLAEARRHASARRLPRAHGNGGEYVSRLADGPDASSFSQARLGRNRHDALIDGARGLGLRSASFDDNGEATGARGRMPIAITGSTEGASRFGFSTSLSQIRRHNAETDATKVAAANNALGLAYGTLDDRSPFNPFDIWIEGKYSSFTDHDDGFTFDGHFASLSFGADYVVNPSVLVGVFVQFDSMEQRSEGNLTDVSGDGWIAGSYATVALRDDLFWQVRAGWGQSENEISPKLTYTDEFETTRWLISSKLSGRYEYGHWTVRPELSVSYISETAKSYTDNFDFTIPEVRTRLGQATAGPVVSYRHETVSGIVFEPHFGLHVVWDFASETTAEGFGPANDDVGGTGVRARTDFGLRASTLGGLGLDVSGSYDGIGNADYSALTGRAALRVPLN